MVAMNQNELLSAKEVVEEKIAMENEMPVEDRWDVNTVYQLLQQTAARLPERPALSFQLTSEPGAKSETYNWGQLIRRTTQAANAFRGLGVGETDVVAYLLPSINETVITLMGGMTAGIVMPVNPLLETVQIAAILKESNAKVLVTLKAFPKTDLSAKAAAAAALAPNIGTIVEVDLAKHLDPIKKIAVNFMRPKHPVSHKAEIVDFEALLNSANGVQLEFDESSEDRFCAYFHTGGTTGTPKVAQHRHSGALFNGWITAEKQFVEDDALLCPLPLFHVYAAYPMWMGCVASGAHMVLPTPSGYRGEGVFDNFWKLVERWKISYITTVPTAVSMLMQKPIDADTSTMKAALCGSAPMPVELFKRFQNTLKIEIVEGYGMTEATCITSSNPLDGEKKIGSVGIPVPYCDVKILDCDAEGTILAEKGTNEVGEICIYNPGVVVGATYTQDSKNNGLYAGGKYLRSGDLGRLDEDGYLWITGRAKDLIIRGGHNIDPAMIEEALAGHSQVAMVGAIGQPDAKAGEIPCAYVELIADGKASVEELMNYAAEHIVERAAVPKYLEILDELPKTAVGKVFKPDLRKSAIERIFNDSLDNAGIKAKVVSVVDDKKLGLVALLQKTNASVSEADIDKVLGSYSNPWQWSE